MQLATTHATGAIRHIIIAPTTILTAPLNTSTQEGTVNKIHGVLNYEVLANAIHLKYLPNSWAAYEQKYVPNKGHEINININMVGIKKETTNKLYKLNLKLVVLVNLYADALNEWLIVGDAKQPIKLTNIDIKTGDKNSDQAKCSLSMNTLTRETPPLYTGYF